jgi:hypothetical protein
LVDDEIVHILGLVSLGPWLSFSRKMKLWLCVSPDDDDRTMVTVMCIAPCLAPTLLDISGVIFYVFAPFFFTGVKK